MEVLKRLLRGGTVKEVYELKGQVQSIRGIARGLGVSRNSVRKYLRSPGLPREKGCVAGHPSWTSTQSTSTVACLKVWTTAWCCCVSCGSEDIAVEWRVALKPGQRRKLEPGSLAALAEHVKASIRAQVEHPFLKVKRLFGYAKTRYRGLAKNTQRLALLLGLGNLLTPQCRLTP